MTTVTFSRKCYVFSCAGCGSLDESARRDQLTCSPACRVTAHRNGSLKLLRAVAKSYKVPPASILHARAVEALRPDLVDRMKVGRLTIDEAMPDVYLAFVQACLSAARRHDDAL